MLHCKIYASISELCEWGGTEEQHYSLHFSNIPLTSDSKAPLVAKLRFHFDPGYRGSRQNTI